MKSNIATCSITLCWKRELRSGKKQFGEQGHTAVNWYMLSSAYVIQPVKPSWTWTETIYIRADGSVEPYGAPISTVDNIFYKLTDIIIVDIPITHTAFRIERDNIVVDGAGYTLQGTGSGIGFYLLQVNNVAIRNMQSNHSKPESVFKGHKEPLRLLLLNNKQSCLQNRSMHAIIDTSQVIVVNLFNLCHSLVFFEFPPDVFHASSEDFCVFNVGFVTI